VGLKSEVGAELSPNFQDTTIWDKTNVNRRIGSNHCKSVSKELRIDILRLPTRNSEEPKDQKDQTLGKLIHAIGAGHTPRHSFVFSYPSGRYQALFLAPAGSQKVFRASED